MRNIPIGYGPIHYGKAYNVRGYQFNIIPNESISQDEPLPRCNSSTNENFVRLYHHFSKSKVKTLPKLMISHDFNDLKQCNQQLQQFKQQVQLISNSNDLKFQNLTQNYHKKVEQCNFYSKQMKQIQSDYHQLHHEYEICIDKNKKMLHQLYLLDEEHVQDKMLIEMQSKRLKELEEKILNGFHQKINLSAISAYEEEEEERETRRRTRRTRRRTRRRARRTTR